MSKLTIKQKRFADEYIISGNAYQAALKAGYSENYAKNASYKMVENSGKLSSYINARMNKMSKSTIATQEEILEYLTSVVRNDEEGTRDKIKAAELLGKRYGSWIEKSQVELTTPNIIFDIKDE